VSAPSWLAELVGIDELSANGQITLAGEPFELRDGILRQRAVVSERQAQTSDTFGFKWHKRDTFESDASVARMKAWLVERYGDVGAAGWWDEYGERPVLLDAGCGGALSALALFEQVLPRVRFVGVDISDAVDVAADRFAERGLEAAFVQADLNRIPLPDGSVDVLFSEGVLHHTDSTRDALLATARLLAPGGRFLLYVYRRKGPIREFTDDYIRERLQEMAPQEAWDAVMPLTRLGKLLGDLEVEVDVPEDIELLAIPAGRIDLQRLFYWHVFKAFHHPDLTLDELNHINFDWYAPRNAHRQSPEDVRAWWAEAGLQIEREVVEDAGITIVARRTP
jgi:SAM-dependent methyltransferase